MFMFPNAEKGAVMHKSPADTPDKVPGEGSPTRGEGDLDNNDRREGEHNMSREELKEAAINCLAKAFKGDEVPVHVVQAATAIVLTPAKRS